MVVLDKTRATEVEDLDMSHVLSIHGSVPIHPATANTQDLHDSLINSMARSETRPPCTQTLTCLLFIPGCNITLGVVGAGVDGR